MCGQHREKGLASITNQCTIKQQTQIQSNYYNALKKCLIKERDYKLYSNQRYLGIHSRIGEKHPLTFSKAQLAHSHCEHWASSSKGAMV